MHRFLDRSFYRFLGRFVCRLPGRSVCRRLGRFVCRLPDSLLCRLLGRFLCRLLDRVTYRHPRRLLCRLFYRSAFASLAALVGPPYSAVCSRLAFVDLHGTGFSRVWARGHGHRVYFHRPLGTSRLMEIRHIHHRLTEVPSVDMLIEA